MAAPLRVRFLMAASLLAAGRAAATPLDEAWQLIRDGRYAEAETAGRLLLAEAEAAGRGDSLAAAGVLDLLVEALRLVGKEREPETQALAERGLAIRERALPADHPDIAQSLITLAGPLNNVGDYARSRELYERALAIRERALGPESVDLAKSLNNLANSLYALAIREQALGPDHPEAAKSLLNLANLLRDAREYARADSLYARALAVRERALGPDHPLVALILDDRAVLLLRMGAGPEALDLALRGAEGEMLRYATSRTSGLGVALSVAARGGDVPRLEAACDAVVRSRALVLRGRGAGRVFSTARSWAATSNILLTAVAHAAPAPPKSASPPR